MNRVFAACAFALALYAGHAFAGYPQTSLHYAPNANFDSMGNYAPGAAGFNLADVSSPGLMPYLPAGVKALVFLGLCNGADVTFVNTVTPYLGDAKVFGFYLMDEPDPTGKYQKLCPPANLKAESDWIHAYMPGAKTFIVLMSLGVDADPNYAGSYTPANSDIDYFGLDPYPCKQEWSGCNFSVIPKSVLAAQSVGIPKAQLIPVYQAFGGGGYSAWLLPTQAQEQQILTMWGMFLPTPAWDYAYSWGSQLGDQSIETTPYLQQIFTQKNTGH